MKDISTESNNPHSAAFWSWNGRMEKSEMLRQIERFHEMGLGGFFMHSRTGLATPYLSEKWFELIRFCQAEAAKRGMKAWIYDEDRFPSGPAGGKIPAENPSCRMQLLFLWEEGGKLPFPPGRTVGRPFLSKTGKRYFFTQDEQPHWSWYNDQCYIDGINPLTAKKFLECTHEEYLKHCAEGFPGVFTDEPNYGRVCVKMDWQGNCDWCTTPYDERVRMTIKRRYGYDLLEHLPELFGLVRTDRFSAVRMHYIKIMTELFTQNFIRPIGTWHKKHNLIFTGHVMGEDTLLTQTTVYGDVMQAYPHFTMPGIDVLCDNDWNRLPPAQVRSVARQYGKKECLAELYGGTGWDFGAEGHKSHGDRLLLDGITFRCHHKADYSLKNEAKRDYPASISYQLEWCRDYRVVEEYFKNICQHLSGADRPADILVISPIESAWGHFGMNVPSGAIRIDSDFARFQQDLYHRQLSFDLGSEELLSRDGKVRKKQLCLKKMSYRAVVLPRMETMRRTTRELLEQFSASGGLIIAPFGLPKLEDGYPGRKSVKIRFRRNLDALSYFRKILFSSTGNSIYGTIFRRKGKEMLFVYNPGAVWNSANDNAPWEMPCTANCQNAYPEVTIDWLTQKKGVPCEYIAQEDRCCAIKCGAIAGGWRIHTSLDRLQSRLFILGKKQELSFEKVTAKRILPLPSEVKYRLEEKNILLFDHFSCQGISEEQAYVLELDRKLRQSLSLPEHSGFIVQPWAQKAKTPSVPRKAARKTLLRATFHSSGEFPAELVMENPELFEVYLNGRKLSQAKPERWWFDLSFKCLDIPKGIIISGENLLELRTDYDESHPGIEAVYLRGDFAVDMEPLAIRDLPPALPTGKDWTKCGLPFYQGTVTCMIPVKSLEGDYLLPRFSGMIASAKCKESFRQILAFPPYQVNIPAETEQMELSLTSSPRNFLGPFFYDYPVYVSAPMLFWQNHGSQRKMGPFGWNLNF